MRVPPTSSPPNFTRVSQKVIDDMFRHSFRSWIGTETHEVRIELSPLWARRIKPRQLFDSQIVEKRDDGSIVFETIVNSLEEIASWVVSRGAGVRGAAGVARCPGAAQQGGARPLPRRSSGLPGADPHRPRSIGRRLATGPSSCRSTSLQVVAAAARAAGDRADALCLLWNLRASSGWPYGWPLAVPASCDVAGVIRGWWARGAGRHAQHFGRDGVLALTSASVSIDSLAMLASELGPRLGT